MIENIISVLLGQPFNSAVSIFVGLVTAAGLRSQLLINENLVEFLNKKDSLTASYSQSEGVDKQLLKIAEPQLGNSLINIFCYTVAFVLGFIAAWSIL